MNILRPKKVRLEALDLEVSVGLFTHFQDGGAVSDLVEHGNELYKKYFGRNMSPTGEKICSEAVGMFHAFTPKLKKDFSMTDSYHIAHISIGDEVRDLFLRAHEETHFLRMTNNLGYLKRGLVRDVGVDPGIVDFLGIEERKEELTCDIGGFYAIDKRGWLGRDLDFEGEDFELVRDLYMDGKGRNLLAYSY